MNPTTDIKGEHVAITIILEAMKKMALDLRTGKFIDSYRIVQILDFLHTFTEKCHYEKEEECLYPALLEFDIPWTVDTINHLINEHKLASVYLKEMDALFQEYLSGNTSILKALSLCMFNYIELEQRHINIVDNIVLPLCEKVFDSKILKAVSIDLRKKQDHAVGHLKHQEYYKLLAMLYAENNVMSESI